VVLISSSVSVCNHTEANCRRVERYVVQWVAEYVLSKEEDIVDSREDALGLLRRDTADPHDDDDDEGQHHVPATDVTLVTVL
jgi:hypothetical protein